MNDRQKKDPQGRGGLGKDEQAFNAASASKDSTELAELQATIEADDLWLADWLKWFDAFRARNGIVAE